MWLPYIKLENYKLFKKQTFEFAPITLLTGPNNSGKSSLMHIILSIFSSQTNGSLIFQNLVLNNQFIRLGDFNRIITNGNRKSRLNITIPIVLQSKYLIHNNFSIQYNFKGGSNLQSGTELKQISLFVELEKESKKIFTFSKVDKHTFYDGFEDDEVWFTYFNIEILVEYLINIKKVPKNFLFFNYGHETLFLNLSDIELIRNKEIKLIKWFINDELSTSKLSHFLNNFQQFGYFEDLFDISISDPKKVSNFLKEMNLLGFNFKKMQISDIGYNFFDLHMREIFTAVFFHSIDCPFYYSSFRTVTAIQETVINLSNINSPLIAAYFKDVIEVNKSYMTGSTAFKLKEFINYWLVEFEVGNGLNIQIIDESNIIFKVINDTGGETHLIDLGLGYRNLVFLLLAITSNCYRNSENNSFYSYPFKPIILFEEPEINLHPKLQSKLADLIVDAKLKFNIQFIIETHSEYFIRKLQFLTATKRIQSEDIALYYFNKKLNNGFNRINVLESGALSHSFGNGFFDEATNWQFELYKVQSQQRN